ncbi:MAG: polyphosphate kinase 2, partial [Paracoccaceae bacterium]
MDLPFDGAISRFFAEDAPEVVRRAILEGSKKDILSDSYPYDRRLNRDEYDSTLHALQIELVKLQAHVKSGGGRIAVVFEGRDAA